MRPFSIKQSSSKILESQRGAFPWLFGAVGVGGIGTLLYYDRGDLLGFRKLHAQSVPAPTDIVIEQTKKKPDVTKEENRELVSSQHVQVKKSWENPGIFAWGSNTGRVPAPDSDEAYIKHPRRISYFDGQITRDLKLSRDFAAALSENGDLYQWGVGYSTETRQPARTLAGKNLVSLALSKDRIIALSSSGTVYSIPASRQEQETGPKLRESSWIPFWTQAAPISYRTIQPTLSTFERVTAISSGSEHALMLTTSGRIFSAVSSSTSFPTCGQLGVPGLTWENRPTGSYDQPHELATLRGFKATSIATGDLHSLVLDAEGRVFAFGDNSLGQLGQQPSAEVTAVDAPSLLPTARLYAGSGKVPSVTSIAAGGSNSFFLIDATQKSALGETSASPSAQLGRVSADAWACGGGVLGQLGAGRWIHMQGTPIKIKALSGLFEYDETNQKIVPIRVARLSIGATHSAAVLANITYLDAHSGTSEGDTNWGADVVWWGGNEHWQLGTGKRSNCASPVYIGPLGAGDGKEKREEHRLHLTPRKKVRLGNRSVSMEQRVECGRFVTAVYSGA